MQLGALVVHQFAGADADLEMRRDRFFIETVGLSRQLEFAVERLVGHAQQGAVRHTEAAVSYTHLDVYKRQVHSLAAQPVFGADDQCVRDLGILGLQQPPIARPRTCLLYTSRCV